VEPFFAGGETKTPIRVDRRLRLGAAFSWVALNYGGCLVTRERQYNKGKRLVQGLRALRLLVGTGP
jgi:hypothetical protein